MRMMIDIDEALLEMAQHLSGSESYDETVEQALKLMVQMYQQQNIRQLRGKLHWEGDLEQMRQGIDPTE